MRYPEHRIKSAFTIVVAGLSALVTVSALATPIATDETLTDTPPQTRANFGTALATGDINGDSADDLVVGAPRPGFGRAVVLYGPEFASRTTIPAPDSEPLFGEAVATGDVNNDGYDDVIAGSKYADVGFEAGAGEAFVFYGPALATWQRLVDPQPQSAAAFGVSVSSGDLNADGFDEVIVGAWDSNIPPFVKAGQAFVYWGPALTTVTTLQSPQPQNVADFGVASTVGDFNGDGIGDALLGSWISDVQPGDDAGQVFVFTGPSLSLLTSLRDPVPGRQIGMSVAAGNIDGDAAEEVLAGAEGRAVLFDHAGGAAYASQRLLFPEGWSGAAASVAVADATGDAIDDLSVGVTSNAGAAVGALLFPGGATARPPYQLVPAGAGRAVALPAGLLAASDPLADIAGVDEAGVVHIAAVEDADGDAWLVEDDNCPSHTNVTQANNDGNSIDLAPAAPFDDLTRAHSDLVGDACDADDDNDGLADALELSGAACDGHITVGNEGDTDGDRVLDGAECTLGSVPTDPQSRPPPPGGGADVDGDGVTDALEERGYNTSADAIDTDADGCSDGREIASVNEDHSVNVLDLQALAIHMGAYPYGDARRYFDVTKDGAINVIDLQFVARHLGAC